VRINGLSDGKNYNRSPDGKKIRKGAYAKINFDVPNATTEGTLTIKSGNLINDKDKAKKLRYVCQVDSVPGSSTFATRKSELKF
jgi:hypothetical protein